ncbi:Pr6Pr family membrane protein [Polymorphospora sp. NPDC050346]|uniref:Pr6Pr family membrane protein n=1 Tax=Polymorphospora sp. NPDC050346 TaxID=3155780 RepID=UPI0033CF314F
MIDGGRRVAVALRIVTVLAVLVGVGVTAVGADTLPGLLPYFTIQSNLLLGCFAAYAALLARRGGQPPAVVKGAVTTYMVITGLVYHLVLMNGAGEFSMADEAAAASALLQLGNQLTHTLTPILAVLDWLLLDRSRARFRYALLWLAYPLAYLAFALVRGLVTGTYPYPFVDVTELGYGGIAVNTLVFGGAFYLIGLAVVAANRAVTRPRRGRGTAPAAGRAD